MTLQEVLTRIQPVDQAIAAQTQARLDRLTKPLGSLGRLEETAVRYATITGEVKPAVPRGVVFTFAADHGVATEGVSAYPREVTPQMVLNFLRGGAGVNVLARHAGVEVRVVDIGVAYDFGSVSGLIHKKVMAGTNNLLVESAMSRDQAVQALQVGIEVATEAAREGIGLIGTGEMGIGNTTPSAAITAVMTGRPVAEVTGRGTGIDEAGHARKAGAAALIAVGLQPLCRDYLIASHRSVERGHQAILEHLRLKPLLDLDLRLGEGTGACLGMSLVQASIKILTEMATFEEAGVSDREA